MRQEYSVKVVSKKMLNSDTAYITIECPSIAHNAVPGQFVNVSCSKFLKRPFGIASVDADKGTFCIGVKVVGKGTKEIAAFDEGKNVTVLGPLGNGFDFEALKDKKLILVAGGTGVFPIHFASSYCKANNIEFKLVQGFRNASQVIMSDDSVILTTDAGDAGIHGNCCNGLDTIDESFIKDAVLCCVGPLPMMKACGPKGFIACTAVNKTFNLAGLAMTNVIICDPELKKETAGFYGMPTPFGIQAVISAYTKGAPWVEALNEYIDGNNAYSMLKINILTGRKNQIRVHMSEIGYPIVGDMVYSNGKNPFEVKGQMLHAKSLEFKHPTTGEKIYLEAPLPEYFSKVLNLLEKEL